jgi:hypothetical protein
MKASRSNTLALINTTMLALLPMFCRRHLFTAEEQDKRGLRLTLVQVVPHLDTSGVPEIKSPLETATDETPHHRSKFLQYPTVGKERLEITQ